MDGNTVPFSATCLAAWQFPRCHKREGEMGRGRTGVMEEGMEAGERKGGEETACVGGREGEVGGVW